MIKCRLCPQEYPDFARTIEGKQRSGYRLLERHLERKHRGGTNFRTASTEDNCPACEGKGCLECEPNGPVIYNFNTLETRH